MVDISRVQHLDWAAESGPGADVRRVAHGATAAEGVCTLNEQACLQLKHRGLRDAELWLAHEGDVAVGFLLRHGQHLVDLAVHPDARRRGTGLALASAALPEGTRVEAWSHADHPAAERLALHFGLPRERELHVMKRSLTDLPPVPDTDGVVIRGYEPGDEDDVVAVNASAFAHHPEQGHMDVEDFQERTREDWFEAAGLLLAVPGLGQEAPPLLGFHWTKVHAEERPAYGEVYVVAVNPKAAGRGLGRALTLAGLHHLAAQDLGEVLLYVDGDNEPAVALYRGLGFEVDRSETQYRGSVVFD